MLNNKNNIFVKAMFFVVLAIVLIVGVTYAYFSADITGVESESTISVGGATLAIKYEGSNSITAQNVIPGWIDKKYFSVDVTNTSGKDISYDINLVVENKVKAIFPEHSVPNETIKSVSEEVNKKGHNVTIGDNLYSDSIGDQDDDNTYIKMYLKNVNTIINAFARKENK